MLHRDSLSRLRLLVVAAPALIGAISCGPTPSGTDGSPVDVSLPPEQTAIEEPEPVRTRDGGWEFVLTPLARYVLRGIVVSRTTYRFDWNTGLSPCDVAMVWGDLAAGDAWRKLRWSQSNRWYFWRWSGAAPLPNETIVRSSSNTHIVPASLNLARAARSLEEGDVAELSGDLVAIEARKGSERAHWRSSLSRNDTGDGSCEVLYLRRVRVAGKVYE